MSEPEGPRADSPGEPPAWGKQPAGGWGASTSQDEETQRVDPRTFQAADNQDEDDRTQAVDQRAFRGQGPGGQGGQAGQGPGGPGYGGPGPAGGHGPAGPPFAGQPP